ncbi:hypothetical protein WA026_012590 [Henosepilachna vigintioctopunctata]|uniref:Uncharacterized protein n=1 Tax=Henosepilachna vigintioctopunctata TaxID=420089 RepID=A0AAW1U183_9CUCU
MQDFLCYDDRVITSLTLQKEGEGCNIFSFHLYFMIPSYEYVRFVVLCLCCIQTFFKRINLLEPPITQKTIKPPLFIFSNLKSAKIVTFPPNRSQVR